MKKILMRKMLLIMLSGIMAMSLIGCGGADEEAEKQYADRVMEICLNYGLENISVDMEWEGEESVSGKKTYDLTISCSGFENIESEDLEQFADDIAACGINGFVMEPTTDMEYIAKRFGKTHCFVGNADCRILTFGSREDIRREVERCVNIGREYPGFVMAVGNHIPSNVPVDHAIYYNECYESLAYRS